MIIRYPLREFSRIERELMRMFDGFWGEKRGWDFLPGPSKSNVPAERENGLTGTPVVDLVDKDDYLILRSEIPGVKKKDIKVSITEDNITISGKVEKTKEEKKENYYYAERTHNSWQRTVPLPVKVKSETAKAKCENGVLEITLPKIGEAKTKKKEIKIE